MGRWTKDPVFRNNGNIDLVEGSIALNKRDKNGKEEVLFMDIVMFGKFALNVSENSAKGDIVLVDGRLVMDQWIDQSGNKRQKFKVIADTIRYLRSASTRRREEESPVIEKSPDPYIKSDDFPF